ncbi:MAG: HlyD family type I secretion periplasmic adaptor subunit [Helicobacteraceae bacterium]|nr:HlyD family type I secretion periplasmic adaptor subunit [Helicobacteraceae bacterium]
MKKNNKPVEYSEKDFEFMNSLSSAVLERTPTKTSKVLKIWIFTIFAFLVWASIAEIDEITRGDGKTIPYGQNQVIQNLEGGIIESILVNEGQIVKRGEVILKINNAKSLSASQTNEKKFAELRAKQLRLEAEANQKEFKIPVVKDEELTKQIALNHKFYLSNKLEYEAKDRSLVEQIEQRKQEYKEAQANIKALKRSLEYVKEEIAMTAPMVQQGIKSKVDFLQLKREANGIENDIEAAELSLPRLRSAIREYRNKRIEAKQLFINNAKEELTKVMAELSRLQTQQIEFTDQVSRTQVKSPVDGIVQKLHVHTIGGVVKPGEDLVEIVPTSKKLVLEIKIKPSDIAFIHPGAEAKVKVSAYDYAIHGGLIGKVVFISPDTVTDKDENTFYLIHVETEKSHLGSDEHPLRIIPGMTVSVDIITGKKTIMQYILKPILKSKDYVFSER